MGQINHRGMAWRNPHLPGQGKPADNIADDATGKYLY
jgi:hypothetical protein